MINKLWRRLLHAVQHRHAERELRDEMEFHLALKRHALETAGFYRATADAEARRTMGNRLLAEDQARDVWMFESAPTLQEAGLIAAYAALMLGICLLTCVVPTRRALRLEPSQVLRADG